MKEEGWIGCDFDGSLAYSGTTVWDGPLGEPIPRMVKRVKRWLREGYEVRIFTARVAPFNKDGTKQSEEGLQEIKRRIGDWCENHIGTRLECTCSKDHRVFQLWDDKNIQLVRDTGKRVGHEPTKRKI